MGILDVRHQRVKLTVTSLSAVCWEEIEENLDGMSVGMNILVATEIAENIFIIFCKVGKFHLFLC